jgi:hypothetical protein
MNPNNYITTGSSFGYSGYNGQAGTAAYGATFATGDIIGIALDASIGSITFYKNNVSQGQVSTGVTGPYYAAISVYAGDAVCTANFGASAFSYSAPAGYTAGFY